MSNAPHVSVMLQEVVDTLSPKDGEVYIDGTLGAGGYSNAILSAAACVVVGVDRDQTAHDIARERLSEHKDRLFHVHDVFSNAENYLKKTGYQNVHGIVLDLGVSSMQFDDGARGFSFREDAPLDMRMGVSADGDETAADIVNTYDEEDLANLIYKYGEERKSRHIASAIVKARQAGGVNTTSQLAEIVRNVVGKKPGDKIDPATRTFQALRIAVNDELGELQRMLDVSLKILKPGGRLVVVTFHSLEDRIVKDFMRQHSGGTANPSRHMPAIQTYTKPLLDLPSKKAIKPSEREMNENSRARSAKMRVAIRTVEPADKRGGSRPLSSGRGWS